MFWKIWTKRSCCIINHKGGDTVQNTKDRAVALVSAYKAAFAEKGIAIVVSKKYFEREVGARNNYAPNPVSCVINYFLRYFDKRREIRFRQERNRYHCIVLAVLPVDKTLVRLEFCREYAFLLRKTERAHVGQKPLYAQRKEEKVLSQIEKRLRKLLRKAEKHTAQTVCRDTLFDALRYCFSVKYEYKSRILGKDGFFWEIALLVSAAAVLLLVMLACWWLSELL